LAGENKVPEYPALATKERFAGMNDDLWKHWYETFQEQD
jgi:hypothetical protein